MTQSNEVEALLGRLEARAKAATFGPWETNDPRHIFGDMDTDHDGDNPLIGSTQNPQDAAFISAANPRAILKLTALIRKLQDELAEARDKTLRKTEKIPVIFEYYTDEEIEKVIRALKSKDTL